MERYILAFFGLCLIALVLPFAIWRSRAHYFVCAHCESTFDISFLTDFSSLYWLGDKYLKCPNCGEVGWAKSFRKFTGTINGY